MNNYYYKVWLTAGYRFKNKKLVTKVLNVIYKFAIEIKKYKDFQIIHSGNSKVSKVSEKFCIEKLITSAWYPVHRENRIRLYNNRNENVLKYEKINIVLCFHDEIWKSKDSLSIILSVLNLNNNIPIYIFLENESFILIRNISEFEDYIDFAKLSNILKVF